MNISINPIGVINKSGKRAKILIYSEFENIISNVTCDIQKGIELLVVHRNVKKNTDHQVKVSMARLVERVGNLLTVSGIVSADGDSVIDLRRIDEITC
jgi:predicted acetyltransferase